MIVMYIETRICTVVSVLTLGVAQFISYSQQLLFSCVSFNVSCIPYVSCLVYDGFGAFYMFHVRLFIQNAYHPFQI